MTPRAYAGHPQPLLAPVDWVDRSLLAAWFELQDDLCPKCGRPNEVHKTDSPGDYRVAFFNCTATEAMDDYQTKWHKNGEGLPPGAAAHAKRDAARAKQGYHPDRSRSWFTYTKAEGLPS